MTPKLGIPKIAPLIATIWALSSPTAWAQISSEAQTAPAISKPVWAALPTGDALAQYFPDRAQRMSVSGRATMKCLAGEDGALNACEIVAEFPPGFGFGSATLKAAHFFRLGAADRNGVSVAGRQIVIPLRWNTPRPSPGADAKFLKPVRRGLIWAAAPSQAQMDAAYPATAKGLGIVGLHCVADSSGALSGCAVAFESPQGQDFGVAALRLAPMFRAGARTDGEALEGSPVEVPFHFYPPTDAQWGDGAAAQGH